MPVTAKLSKAFYERLGEDIANELVDWFNQVDATYRADLRDLNERNFQRFDEPCGGVVILVLRHQGVFTYRTQPNKAGSGRLATN